MLTSFQTISSINYDWTNSITRFHKAIASIVSQIYSTKEGKWVKSLRKLTQQKRVTKLNVSTDWHLSWFSTSTVSYRNVP
jgi:hypothetical protein